jgi:hypothetical protein
MVAEFNRESLVNAYINEALEGMDWDTMVGIVADTLEANINQMNDNDLVDMVQDVYPHLLESEEV